MFGINISPYISLLCPSILRIEPYTGCYFNCSYCYARWYKNEFPKPNLIVKKFEKIARRLKRTIPFRMATLCDPFQPLEKELKVSRKILEIAKKYNIPVIINTKSRLILDYVDVLKEGNFVVQISLAFLDKFEPRAPSSEDRLKIIERLIDEGIKVIVRYQPIFPNINDKIEYLEILRDYKVRHIIFEFGRIEKERASDFGIKEFEYYSFNERIVKPKLEYRIAKAREFYEFCKKNKIKCYFCKEGLFIFDSDEDCCGFRYLKNSLRRITLYDIWKELKGKEKFEEVLNRLLKRNYAEKYLKEYPREIRKTIKKHFEALKKYFYTIPKVTPFLKVSGEFLERYE